VQGRKGCQGEGGVEWWGRGGEGGGEWGGGRGAEGMGREVG